MKVNASIISQIDDLKKVEDDWNAFITKHSNSPFLLTGFIKQWLEHNIEKLKPLFIIISIRNRIIGIAPLGIRAVGFRYCRLLIGKDFQPEIVFDSQYKDIILKKTLDILFKKMNCKFIDLYYKDQHPVFSIISKICKEQSISYSTLPETGHAVLCLENYRGRVSRNQRHQFERTERRMKEMGQLNVKWLGKNNKDEIIKKILIVERASWKEPHRLRIGLKTDPVLSYIIDGCIETASKIPEFDWETAILELDEKPIAYSLFINYQGTIFCCKTSFDNKYRKQGAGIYINHVTMHKLTNLKNIKVIDFMTDLPFSHNWATGITQTYRLRLWKNEPTTILIKNILSSKVAKKTISDLKVASSIAKIIVNTLYK